MSAAASAAGETTVLVLAGGLGTRLRPLTHTVPKVLVPVLGRPFLEHVLEDFALQGFSRFVLSVGYLADPIRDHFGDGARRGLRIEYVEEREPRGTGGAIHLALPRLSDPFVVVNGDTLLELSLAGLLRQHRASGLGMTLAVVRVEDRGRYGAVHVDGAGRIVRFDEKQPGAPPGLINGGVCAMSAGFLRGAPEGPFSLERDLLPARAGHIGAFETRGYFVDMGTHEALAELDASLAAYLARRPANRR